MGRPLTLDKIHISDQGIMCRMISHIFSKNYIKVQNKPLLIKKKTYNSRLHQLPSENLLDLHQKLSASYSRAQ